jgi:hypothetical protein
VFINIYISDTFEKYIFLIAPFPLRFSIISVNRKLAYCKVMENMKNVLRKKGLKMFDL